MHPLNSRPRYSDAQLSTFLSALSPPIDISRLRDEIAADPLAALARLQRRTMAFNAWGNIALHYSSHRQISLEPDALFHKIVERRLGGYCMENNTFFANVLRGLGFELFITGARIAFAVEDAGNTTMSAEEREARRDGFSGWHHEVLIVIIRGDQYLVDIGFGSQGCLSPMIIRHGARTQGVPGITQRLSYRTIPHFTDPTQKIWVVEVHTASASSPTPDDNPLSWSSAYCFSTQEWLPADFEIINFRTSNDPKSWFTYKLVLSKPLLDAAGENGEGVVTLLDDEITRRMGSGPKEVLRKCASEEERVDALERWFGVKLNEEEKKGGRESKVRIGA